MKTYNFYLYQGCTWKFSVGLFLINKIYICLVKFKHIIMVSSTQTISKSKNVIIISKGTKPDAYLGWNIRHQRRASSINCLNDKLIDASGQAVSFQPSLLSVKFFYGCYNALRSCNILQ